MSVDLLQEKIRKLKNPSVVDFGIPVSQLPPHLVEEEGSLANAYGRFCRELMEALKDTVPAVRFSFGAFALLDNGLPVLASLLKEAEELGYYVILDGVDTSTPWAAERAAQTVFAENKYPCHGLIISPYIGSDAIRPFASYCKQGDKSLFATARSANKSALELQDLLSGSRLVHMAAMDMINRLGDGSFGKCGYSSICAVISATAASSVQTVRSRYNRVFLLVDGVDYPSGNYKNASGAFDRFGHGAAVSAGPSVTCAWAQEGLDSREYVRAAVAAADRMKKNITRYVTVL